MSFLGLLCFLLYFDSVIFIRFLFLVELAQCSNSDEVLSQKEIKLLMQWGSKIKIVKTSNRQLIALQQGVVKQVQSGFKKLLFIAVFVKALQAV